MIKNLSRIRHSHIDAAVNGYWTLREKPACLYERKLRKAY